MTLQDELAQKALSLSERDRAQLARQLILSLEGADVDPDVDAAWETEIERRFAEVDSGAVKPVDWREAVQRIKSHLNGKSK